MHRWSPANETSGCVKVIQCWLFVALDEHCRPTGHDPANIGLLVANCGKSSGKSHESCPCISGRLPRSAEMMAAATLNPEP